MAMKIEREDDPLRAARGILCGMVLGSIMWVVIIAVIAWLRQ